MKIAVVGLRGIPATHGGIEKHCEEIYTRLAEKGYDITVYARKNYLDNDIKEFKNIKIKQLWTFNSKFLENPFHTFSSMLHIIFSDAEIIHIHAQGPCLFAWIPWIFARNKKLVFTCHGIDWQRNKWNPVAKAMIIIGEILSAKLFDAQIMVSDNLGEYYRKKYNINSIKITNGTNINEPKPAKLIKEKFGLDVKDYIFFVGRLVPEKAPHKLIEAFKQIKTDKKLVIVGGSASTDGYEDYLKKISQEDSRIIFTSYLYGDDLAEIYSNAYLYVSTSELEGLPLTLLEAMSYGIPSLVSSIPPHIEVIGSKENYGYLFKTNDINAIRDKLQFVLDKPEEELIKIGLKAQKNIKIRHDWHSITRKLELTYHFAKLNTA